MNLKVDKEWLLRKLAKADDTTAGAAGTSLDELKQAVERLTVTPNTLAAAPSEIGKVVRFRREQRGLTRKELAASAGLSDEEIIAFETYVEYKPSLRAVVGLADALELSRERMKVLAGYVAGRTTAPSGAFKQRFAASSDDVNSVSDEQYEAIRALVEVLAEKK